MLRNDGNYTIYKIQHRQDDGKWVYSSLDSFGRRHMEVLKHFQASGECWQKTGESGVFVEEWANELCNDFAHSHAGRRFRVVRVVINQQTTSRTERFVDPKFTKALGFK